MTESKNQEKSEEKVLKIKYLKGDATVPQTSGFKIICHINNTLGKWGKGFVMAVSNRWPITRKQYLEWYNEKIDFGLGAVQFINVEKYICVANMIGQKGIKTGSNGSPIRYDAVKQCLEGVARYIKKTGNNASVHMPRIGCGLAGGKWDKIEPIIQETLIANGIPVYVYDR
jgi:O-acetyl-ADP-ribose deacetylase (regulator of RNase III)